MVDLIGIAPTSSSIQRNRSQRFEVKLTPNWKEGYLQVVEKMVDLDEIADDLLDENERGCGVLTANDTN
jgi:hypothetical protein